MSPVSPPQRVRDIPAAHAEGLSQVHRLTAETTTLASTLDIASPPHAERLELRRQIAAVDRDRALLEIRLRGGGVPTVWLDVARRLGAAHRPWTQEQILPPVRRDLGRRDRNRVAVDTHLLVDMAAVSVVRDHLHAHHRHIDTDPAATDQFRRNMSAVWQRSVATARIIGFTATERAQVTATATADLAGRVARYRDLSPDDIDTLWHAYTGGALAEIYRRHIPTNTAPESGAAVLPTPQQWLDRAHTHLTTPPPPSSTDIDRALTAAMPTEYPTETPSTEPDPGYGADDIAYPDLVIEAGPDP